MTAPDLLPCPFCGGPAFFDEISDEKSPDFGGHFIQCKAIRCGATTNLYFAGKDDPRPLLAEQWNRRIPLNNDAAIVFIQWCLTHEDECLGDHPKVLAKGREALTVKLHEAATRGEANPSPAAQPLKEGSALSPRDAPSAELIETIARRLARKDVEGWKQWSLPFLDRDDRIKRMNAAVEEYWPQFVEQVRETIKLVQKATVAEPRGEANPSPAAQPQERAAIIEECAKVAEERYSDRGWHEYYRAAANEVAACIRSLATKQEKPND
jgi:hypothetical protein